MFSIKQHNSCKTGIQGLVHLYLHRYNANYLGKALPPKKKTGHYEYKYLHAFAITRFSFVQQGNVKEHNYLIQFFFLKENLKHSFGMLRQLQISFGSFDVPQFCCH